MAKTKEEKTAARKEAKAIRNAAKTLALDFIKSIKDSVEIPEDVLQAFTILTKTGSNRVRGERGPSNASLIKEKIMDEGNVSDVDLFMEFKVAQREMAGHIRNWIKKGEPADRVWISFDKENECYVFVGEGEYPPENWEGYIPATDDLD